MASMDASVKSAKSAKSTAGTGTGRSFPKGMGGPLQPKPPSAKPPSGSPRDTPRRRKMGSTNQVNRVVKTPEESAIKIFETRIVDVSGTSIECSSPRLEKALHRSGVEWEDLKPKALKVRVSPPALTD